MKEAQVHISTIKSGDTVIHYGIATTVGKKDIKHNSFIGYTLFGDSYRLGSELITKITY